MILYEMITLSRPFADCKSSIDVSRRLMAGELPRIAAKLRASYSNLASIYDVCTKLRPNLRPTAAELVAALQSSNLQKHPIPGRRAPIHRRRSSL